MIFSSKNVHQQYFHENFHKHFSWKLFASKFSLRFFSRIYSRSRIFTRIEWWYSQAPNRPREEDTDDFRFPTFGKTPALSRKRRTDRISQIFEISALVGNPSPTSTNILFFLQTIRSQSSSDSRPDFAYDTSPIAGRSHQSFSSSGACGTCVSYDASQKTVHTIAT